MHVYDIVPLMVIKISTEHGTHCQVDHRLSIYLLYIDKIHPGLWDGQVIPSSMLWRFTLRPVRAVLSQKPHFSSVRNLISKVQGLQTIASYASQVH